MREKVWKGISLLKMVQIGEFIWKTFFTVEKFLMDDIFEMISFYFI